MAPAFYTGIDITPTRIDTSNTITVSSYSIYQKVQKKETKKQKQKRIAKERMLASWKTYNDKTPTVKVVKQICKPIHRMKYK